MAAPLPAAALLLRREQQKQEYAPSGVREADRLLGGLPRGAITELTGRRSSGRTAVACAVLAAGTRRLECCAYVDASNSFDPHAAAAAGAVLERLLWVRCGGQADVALKATDLLVHAGGFGIICLDLGGVPARVLNRIPASYWFRFRRAIEHTPTALVVVGEEPNARSCSLLWLRFEQPRGRWNGAYSARLFAGLAAKATVEKPGPPESLHLPADRGRSFRRLTNG